MQPRFDSSGSQSFHEHLQRSALLLGKESLECLRRATVLIAGLGGTGGALAVTLARMGVGNFILVDPGRFDAPDTNRQWAADSSTLGRGKAEVYADLLPRLVPGIAIDVHPEGIQPHNVESLVSGADLVCDNLDITVGAELRARMLAQAREQGIYSMSCPILGFGALLAVAAPLGAPMTLFLRRLAQATNQHRLPAGLWEVFQPEHLEKLEQQLGVGHLPSVSVAPLVSAALSATEAALILLEGHLSPWRKPVTLPEVIVVDLFRMNYAVMDVERI